VSAEITEAGPIRQRSFSGLGPVLASLVSAVIFAATGALVTTVVAVCAIAWSPTKPLGHHFERIDRDHSMAQAMMPYDNASRPFEAFLLWDYEGLGWQEQAVLGARRSFLPDEEHTLSCFRAGWPMLCFEGQQHLIDGQFGQSGLVSLPRPPLARGWRHETVPWHPIWPAFLANSALFGAMSFVVARGLRRIRSRIRRSGGRCQQCGYRLVSVAGAATITRCPECGKAP